MNDAGCTEPDDKGCTRQQLDRKNTFYYNDRIDEFGQKEVSRLPKCYSEQEREYIRKRLKEEAADCMARYGIRRTTVDEIVKRVKIPKGTFYLFYQSKELLLFDVILEQHDLIEKKLFESVSQINPATLSAEQLTDIILSFYQMAGRMPILKILNSDEVELLARKLPPEVVAEHLGHDDSMVERIFSQLPIKKDIDSAAVSAAFRALYFSTLHREEIGEEKFDEALRTLIYGLVIQFL